MIITLVILAIIQGISEFFPISSSGHLVVLYNMFGITDNTIMLSIFFHIATLLAVCIVYRKTLWSIIKNPFTKTTYLLLTSTIVTIIMVLIFEKFIVNSFSGEGIILSFLFTAILLSMSEFFSKHNINILSIFPSKKQNNLVNNYTNNTHSKNVEIPTICKLDTTCSSNGTNLLSKSDNKVKDDNIENNINLWQALFIGFMQGIATIPGISRSGSTISAGLMSGVDKETSANYSFLLSIPIILASLVYQLIKFPTVQVMVRYSVLELMIAFVVCFIVGWLSLKFMINIVKKNKLYYFSIYLVLLCVFLILNKYVLFLF